MAPGMGKAFASAVLKLQTNYSETSILWHLNQWKHRTCIASGLGFSLVSNQKNLRVVSRLIWKKDKRTQKNTSIHISEIQWLYCPLLTCCLVSAISMMFLKLMLDVTNNELPFSPEGIWVFTVVEKRAFQIQCRNVKCLKTRTSLYMGMWKQFCELPRVDWVALSCVLLVLHICASVFSSSFCSVVRWYCISDPEWKVAWAEWKCIQLVDKW